MRLAAYLGATLLLAVALSLYLTPLVRRGAIRFEVLDRPDGRFKRHAAPVPYLGGIAVYVSFLVALALVFEFSAELLGLLLGATLVTMLGLFDDLRVLPARIKLAGQLLATWAVLRSDISIALVTIPEWLAVPLTILWLVGITNALNILDVSDGLCGGVAAIAALGLGAVAAGNGDLLMAATMFALAGSLAGFLPYNWSPARIFLGDSGSLFVGFTLGVVALVQAYTRRNEVAVLAPLAILIVPLLEVTLVVAARLRRGHSPFAASHDHFALRLRAQGWSAANIALFSYSVGMVGSLCGVAMVWAPRAAALGLAGVVALLFVGLFTVFWRLGSLKAPAVLQVDDK